MTIMVIDPDPGQKMKITKDKLTIPVHGSHWLLGKESDKSHMIGEQITV